MPRSTAAATTSHTILTLRDRSPRRRVERDARRQLFELADIAADARRLRLRIRRCSMRTTSTTGCSRQFVHCRDDQRTSACCGRQGQHSDRGFPRNVHADTPPIVAAMRRYRMPTCYAARADYGRRGGSCRSRSDLSPASKLTVLAKPNARTRSLSSLPSIPRSTR